MCVCVLYKGRIIELIHTLNINSEKNSNNLFKIGILDKYKVLTFNFDISIKASVILTVDGMENHLNSVSSAENVGFSK